jgi:hypothetical protein
MDSYVNPVRKSSTSNGKAHPLNPVFAPVRDESLTGFAEKGIVFIPAASPAPHGVQGKQRGFLTG